MKPEAQLVFDGRELHIPTQCGTAAPGQLTGTLAENLAELAGRECYDSLGRGRDTRAYHQHILEVGHGSVYEHYNFTVGLPGLGAWDPAVGEAQFFSLLDLMNRPGTYLLCEGGRLRLTLNLRCILDWERWCPPHRDAPIACPTALQAFAHAIAPNVIKAPDGEGSAFLCHGLIAGVHGHPFVPIHDEERWVTLRLTGSRGFSHEQVRHGDRTAISQRSTRYVNESDSDWCLHPLVHEVFDADDVARGGAFIDSARGMYDLTVAKAEPFLIARGVDKGTARKQARGAARGWLGNALGTSLIFSASVAQWRRMIALRAHPAADGEIRASAAAALGCLKQSVFADRFGDMVLVPSPDGIGEVLANAPTG